MSSSPKPPPAILGGYPTKNVDIPISSVFLALFLLGAVSHMTLFQINRRRSHKFVPSAVTFGFCMSRIAATSVRIAWAVHPTNSGLSIAAQILVNAGVVLLFILNLLFVQRILRACLPRIGWNMLVSWTFKAVYILIVCAIVMVITVTIQRFNTSDPNILRIDRDVQLAAVTYIAVISFLPLPILILTILCTGGNLKVIESFGAGSWKTKLFVVTVSSILMCLGASFRAGTAWKPSRPATDPPWYDHKACFYVFNFTLEIIVVFLFLIGRVDRRFHVPDGSSKVREYCGGVENVDVGGKSEQEMRTGVWAA